MVISLVMAPDKHLALEVPLPFPPGWDSEAVSGRDKGTYGTRQDAVAEYETASKQASQPLIPLDLPPIIDLEPYNWRLPQRGMPDQSIQP